jgi:hypothetical protein
MKTLRPLHIGFAVVAALAVANEAQASLVLTAAGIADGFSLSVFASGIPNVFYPPPEIGIATTSSGNVLVTNQGGSPPSTYSWTDVDGQTPGSALANSSIGTSNTSITNAQGKIYTVDLVPVFNGNIDLLNNDGSFNSVFMALPGGANRSQPTTIATDPVNGHIYVDSGNGINDIDPVTKTVRLVVPDLFGTGMAFSPDGNTLYVSEGDEISWYSTATGALIGSLPQMISPSGIGVIQSGNMFNGYLVANGVDGDVLLLDPASDFFQVLIASGGDGSAFVGVDNNNGTLFLTEAESVYRLSCGPGCQFVSTTPEPGTIFLTVIGVGWLMRRRAFASKHL